MGTRNLTMIQHHGKVVVAQYGQWDGYFSGQGQTCVDFILENLTNNTGLDKFKTEVDKLERITSDKEKIVENDNAWLENYPWLGRSIGAQILTLINKGSVEFLAGNNLNFEFGYDSLMCEYAYCVNLDNKTFEIYEGFQKDPLKKGERFYKEEAENSYFGCHQVKSYLFSALKIDTLVLLEKELSPEEEES